MNDLTFHWWEDYDKKKTAREKINDALDAFADKFGRPADVCITSPAYADEIGHLGGVRVEGRSYMKDGKFYTGAMPR